MKDYVAISLIVFGLLLGIIGVSATRWVLFARPYPLCEKVDSIRALENDDPRRAFLAANVMLDLADRFDGAAANQIVRSEVWFYLCPEEAPPAPPIATKPSSPPNETPVDAP